MRFVIKLLAIVLLGLTCQVALEVADVIQWYPFAFNEGHFSGEQAQTLSNVEKRFDQMNAVSQWIVADVFQIPLRNATRIA